ncbi:hypothetical protein [Stenoxybacter acetivorans]|uniref:hypothetical protein n=1 Tax=Stenoxybacter acetivorans TaxID=422441 RepID=UPI000564639A|nr:hypothetical protein [Stenoxybacter acetivorans]
MNPMLRKFIIHPPFSTETIDDWIKALIDLFKVFVTAAVITPWLSKMTVLQCLLSLVVYGLGAYGCLFLANYLRNNRSDFTHEED